MYHGTTDSERFAYPALDEVRNRLQSGALQALTTDVFDTVVWRTVPEPVDAFVALGNALAERGCLDEGLDPRSFGLMREKSEAAARVELTERTGSPEVRLEEIWARVPEWCHRPLSRAEAMDLELEIESDLLVPDLEIADLLRAANRAGVPVYAVSDTYFSGAQLARLLRMPGLEEFGFEEVFTSSDHRTGKAGGLFDLVLERIAVPSGSVAHVGDSRGADLVPAEERDIGAVHLPRRPERLSQILRRESSYRRSRAHAPSGDRDTARADLADLDGSLVQLRAKMSLRREAAEAPGSLRPMYLYGAEVLGPALTGFAEWVVGEAGRMGAKRAHCLMREGEFLGGLIGRAAVSARIDLEPRKLFLNRQVTAAASICEGTPEELGRLLSRRRPPTTRMLLEALGIEPSSVPRVAGHLDAGLDEGTRRVQTLDALCDDEPTRMQILANARALRERIVRLVRREHEATAAPFLLVDLGWGASIQTALTEILRQADAEVEVAGLYLLTHEGAVEPLAHGGRVAGFLASFGHPRVISEAVIRSPEVLEQVCMPGHGTQLGLTRELDPILADACLPQVQMTEAAAVRDGVRSFQSGYLRYRAAVPERVPALSARAGQLAPIVARACMDPTAEEVARLGHWHHDAGQGSDETEELAGGALTKVVRHMDAEQIDETTMADSYWPSALARLHDPQLADLLAARAAGLIGTDPGATEVETGEMVLEVPQGALTDEKSRVGVVPRRNGLGLSFVRASLYAGHVDRVQIRLGEQPAIVRIDRLVLNLHLKDSSEVRTVRLDEPEVSGLIDLINVTRFSDRVFACTAEHGYLSFATAHAAYSRIVYRVDVELSFAAIAWDPTTSGVSGLAAPQVERRLEAVLDSASWRVTKPLRRIRSWIRAR